MNTRTFNLRPLLVALGTLSTGGAFAQSTNDPVFAQVNNQGSYQAQNQTVPGQVIQRSLPRKDLARRLIDNTSLSYYQQFLGPTPVGSGSETYNVFQEGIDSPGTGRAPLQSFHALNLRHQITQDWAIGTTLSAVNGYTREVRNENDKGEVYTNTSDWLFFNARAYVNVPSLALSFGTLYTTLSYEHPTSNISKDDEMRWAWVVAQSFALNLPSVNWSAGLMGQVYRMYYQNNVKAPPFPVEFGGRPTPLQTMIVSGGPYVNYRFSDRWMLGSVVTFDWDQRGVQSSTQDFNNNLSDRARLTLSYFPQKIPFLKSVGLFTQTLLKFRPETSAIGADLTLRF